MRLPRVSTSLLLAATLAATVAAGSSAAVPRPALRDSAQGDWETVLASPRRPWVFLVHLQHAATAWTGAMRVEGLGEFPLHDVRVAGARVRFRFPPELDSLAFDGTLAGDTIAGRVAEAGGPTPTRLTRVVSLPPPANRVEAWRQDLEYASSHLGEYDRSFTPRTREAFRQALARLEAQLPHLDDAQVLVALSRAVALDDNAHTWLRMDPTRQGGFATELPLRLWWFDDGPWVIRAAPAYRKALGCRVIAIEGHPVAEAYDRVSGLFAGNAAWKTYIAPLFLTSPDALRGLGLTHGRQGASFTFQAARGERFTLWVRASAIPPDERTGESWQELSPLHATGRPPWPTALAAKREMLPLYLRHPDEPYWFEFRPRSGLLYFQYNRAENAERGPTFEAFGDSLLAFVGAHPVRGIAVDLRLNSGGDLQVAKAFMQRFARDPRVNRRGRLYVITGHCTFSAGLYHAAQLKQLTQATFVGGNVGDRLDYWAEGGKLVLPRSRAAIAYSNGFHGYSGTDHPAYRPYYEELRVPRLEPDLPVPATAADYFAGRDPALEAIERRLPR